MRCIETAGPEEAECHAAVGADENGESIAVCSDSFAACGTWLAYHSRTLYGMRLTFALSGAFGGGGKAENKIFVIGYESNTIGR